MYLILNSITGQGIGFFFWIIAARFYSEQDIGLAVAILSAMGLLGVFSTFGFGFGLIGYLPKEKNKNLLINTCLTITGIFSAIFAFLYLLTINIWSPPLIFLQQNYIYFIFFIIFSVFGSFLTLQNHIFIGFRVAKFTFIQNIIVMSRILFLPFLVIYGIFGVFSSYGIGIFFSFIAGVILLFIIYPHYTILPTININILKKIFHFSLGNYIASIVENLPNFILPLLIINILGAEMSAFFFIAWSSSKILLMIPRAVSLSLFAEGSHDIERVKDNLVKSIKFIFFPLIVLIIGIYFFGDKLLLIFGKTYSIYSHQLLIMFSLASIPSSINLLYISIKRIKKQTKHIVFIYFFIATSTILFSWIFIQTMGLIGIGFAWILTQSIIVISVIGRYVFISYKERLKIDTG